MSEFYQDLYRCRGCGQIVSSSDEPETMVVASATAARVNLNDGKPEKRICGIFDGGLPSGLYLLHRCNPSRVCICDFIGLEVRENG